MPNLNYEFGQSEAKTNQLSDINDANEANHDANEANHDAINNQILALLKAEPKITQVKLAKEVGVSRATIQRAMKSMIVEGTIVRIGATRGHWEITDENA